MAGSVTPVPVQNYVQVMKDNTTGTYKVLLTDSSGNGIMGYGTTVPADASTGWVTGALFIHTDGAAGSCVYINEGSTTSSDFDPIASIT